MGTLLVNIHSFFLSLRLVLMFEFRIKIEDDIVKLLS